MGRRCGEGTPPPGTVRCVLGAPRGGLHCEFKFGSRFSVVGSAPVLPSIQPSSFLVQGLMQRLPRPTRRIRPLCPSADPGRGPERVGREGGGAAAFPGWAIPSPNQQGRAGGCLQRIGFDITALSCRAGFPSLCPGCSLSEQPSDGFCFCSARHCPESQEKPVWVVAPGGGHSGSPRCGLKVTVGSGDSFQPGWGMDPDRKSMRGSGCGCAAWVERGVHRHHAQSRASPTLWKALAPDLHFHSWICAWDLINVTSAGVL